MSKQEKFTRMNFYIKPINSKTAYVYAGYREIY